jgi:hypothetical protein
MEPVFTDVEGGGRDENIQGSSCMFSDEINLTSVHSGMPTLHQFDNLLFTCSYFIIRI